MVLTNCWLFESHPGMNMEGCLKHQGQYLGVLVSSGRYTSNGIQCGLTDTRRGYLHMLNNFIVQNCTAIHQGW